MSLLVSINKSIKFNMSGLDIRSTHFLIILKALYCFHIFNLYFFNKYDFISQFENGHIKYF